VSCEQTTCLLATLFGVIGLVVCASNFVCWSLRFSKQLQLALWTHRIRRWCTEIISGQIRITVTNKKLSCRRDDATLRVIEYFAKSVKVIQCHSKWPPLSRACVSIPLILCAYILPFLRYSETLIEKRDFDTPLHSTPPLGGARRTECYHNVWYGKTRMVGLPDGKTVLQ